MTVMRWRRAAAWLLAMPLMVAGSQVAHVVAFRLVYPQAHVRLAALLATGHGYMIGYPAFLPLLFGVLGGTALVGFLWGIGCDLRRGGGAGAVPAWAFGLLPPLGFAIQEFLERWFMGVSFPWQVVLEPTFRVGLLLQVPFALAAFLVARLLLRVAEHVGRVLGRDRGLGVRRRLGVRDLAPSSLSSVLRLPVLAAGHAQRGPPL
jgi:hypothetical protein